MECVSFLVGGGVFGIIWMKVLNTSPLKLSKADLKA